MEIENTNIIADEDIKVQENKNKKIKYERLKKIKK